LFWLPSVAAIAAVVAVSAYVAIERASEPPNDLNAAAASRPRNARGAIKRLERISADTEFSSCCFWAWELELAILKNDHEVAKRIAMILGRSQRADGRWALGTDWKMSEDDFKPRLAEDAESWDVAEAANALLDYSEAFGDRSVIPYAEKAAEYLKKSIRYSSGKPYLPHMPECNNVLQPHSTINAALLFSRLPGYDDLARELHDSGVSMDFRRLLPQADHRTLDPPRIGAEEVGDFEKIQIGYYLLVMKDSLGSEILARYQDLSDINEPRGAAYLVLACAKLGRWGEARRFAGLMAQYRPRIGYEYALKDIIDYVNEASDSRRGRCELSTIEVGQCGVRSLSLPRQANEHAGPCCKATGDADFALVHLDYLPTYR
jgi:hypothetical protein